MTLIACTVNIRLENFVSTSKKAGLEDLSVRMRAAGRPLSSVARVFKCVHVLAQARLQPDVERRTSRSVPLSFAVIFKMSYRALSLKGKVVLITGASSGAQPYDKVMKCSASLPWSYIDISVDYWLLCVCVPT